MSGRRVIATDLSGVVLDFQPRAYLASRCDAAVAARFFAEIATPAWFARGDVAPSLSRICTSMAASRPEFSECLRVWAEEYASFYEDVLPGSREFLAWAADIGVEVYAASNAPAGLWPRLVERFPHLSIYQGYLISGDVGVAKPSGSFFDALAHRSALLPGDRLLLLDDRIDYCEAARTYGFDAITVRDSIATVRTAVEGWLQGNQEGMVREEC